MSHSIEEPKRKFAVTRPAAVSFAVLELIRPVTIAAQRLQIRAGRFEIYKYLSAVYWTYRQLKRRNIARKMSRAIARQLGIHWRKGVSPIRILIEATFSSADPKQKSRWVRALQYAAMKSVLPKDLGTFFRLKQGIAGCARRAAQQQPKQNRHRNDWAD